MKGRDLSEFDAYVASRSPALLRTAYLLTGDQSAAEDLLQEALIKLALSWQRVRERESTDAYVRRIMVNVRASHWRRRRVDSQPSADPPDTGIGPDHAHEVTEREALRRALADLPPRMRAVVVLRFFDDLGEAEVAQIMNCSVGTVKSQTSRALAKLRNLPVLIEESPC